VSAGGWAENGTTDGTGPAARFSSQEGLAEVGGVLYSADRDSNTIRALDLSTGAVTTLAGTPGPCGGTNGVGNAARFCRPVGVATDGTRLYVTDSFGETVRAIDLATRAVTTLAGTFEARGTIDGIGHAARFAFPLGLSVLGGTLYVADGGNDTIRAIDLATRAVTTVAGTAGQIGSADGAGPAARFDEPYGLTTDGIRLFIADALNCTVRALNPVTAEVTTVAGASLNCATADGTGQAARFGFLGHLTYGGGALFVADAGDLGQPAVRRVDLATAEVTTLTATHATPQTSNLGYTALPAATTNVDAGGLAASPNGTEVWVTDEYGTGALTGV
jgi:YVTN family beta-propeller protein